MVESRHSKCYDSSKGVVRCRETKPMEPLFARCAEATTFAWMFFRKTPEAKRTPNGNPNTMKKVMDAFGGSWLVGGGGSLTYAFGCCSLSSNCFGEQEEKGITWKRAKNVLKPRIISPTEKCLFASLADICGRNNINRIKFPAISFEVAGFLLLGGE